MLYNISARLLMCGKNTNFVTDFKKSSTPWQTNFLTKHPRIGIHKCRAESQFRILA